MDWSAVSFKVSPSIAEVAVSLEADKGASIIKPVVAWLYLIDLLAPAISIPAPSAIVEVVDPLANVINLSSILSSPTCNSVVSPVTVKFSTTKSSPTK